MSLYQTTTISVDESSISNTRSRRRQARGFLKLAKKVLHTLHISQPKVSSPVEELHNARYHLERAKEAGDNYDLTLDQCKKAKSALKNIEHNMKKSSYRNYFEIDLSTQDSIAQTYYELSEFFKKVGSISKHDKCLRKSSEWKPHIAEKPGGTSTALFVGLSSLPLVVAMGDKSISRSIIYTPSNIIPKESKETSADRGFVQFFKTNIPQPPPEIMLPEPEGHLKNTEQLAHCLQLLKLQDAQDNSTENLDQFTRNWINDTKGNIDECERLEKLAVDVVRAFISDNLKDARIINEVAWLVPVLDKSDFHGLLSCVVDFLERQNLLDFALLEGVTKLIHKAPESFISADDLVKILRILTTKLQETHEQSTQYLYQLTCAVSGVLDAMADLKVEGLERSRLHEPLSEFLEELKHSDNIFLIYQAAYAAQALQHVPDDETPWQRCARLGFDVAIGLAGVVSAVKCFNLASLLESIKKLRHGAGVIKDNLEAAISIYNKGRNVCESIRNAITFERKEEWYVALRGIDIALSNGDIYDFQELIYDNDSIEISDIPTLQMGICDRLGKIAGNHTWDVSVRENALLFLREIYLKPEIWGEKCTDVRKWIIAILTIFYKSPYYDLNDCVRKVLHCIEDSGDEDDRNLIHECRNEILNDYSPVNTLQRRTTGHQTLLSQVQNKSDSDFESNIRHLALRRMEGPEKSIYIAPKAKASIKAPDKASFPLMEKVKEFINSDQEVFLLLGASGSGKSTFNRYLENYLWKEYKKYKKLIPLFIYLPDITKPESDLIPEHLHRHHFTENQIREMRERCEFILICDGYDESLQNPNLYSGNQLNKKEGWRAKILISCRLEYIGREYQSLFQTSGRNHRAKMDTFQEAVIVPFSNDQIYEYIEKYVATKDTTWPSLSYRLVFDKNSHLMGMVTNPFLLSMSLDVIPTFLESGSDIDIDINNINRAQLYDIFIRLWFKRAEQRLVEKKKSNPEAKAFACLRQDGFVESGRAFLKRLAEEIYKNQEGKPVVEYIRARDRNSWKEEFFSRYNEETIILRDACPLMADDENGRLRFNHRSILEYGIASAIFDPNCLDDESEYEPDPQCNTGSYSSKIYNFGMINKDSENKMVFSCNQSLHKTPIASIDFTKNSAVLQFLEGRAQVSNIFKRQLFQLIQDSKVNKNADMAASNAITILIRLGLQFNGLDLRGIRIPGADLSHGVFDYANLEGADLRRTTLRNVWLREANLDGARLDEAEFGEFPYLKQDEIASSCVVSTDCRIYAVGLSNGVINVYSVDNWNKLSTAGCISRVAPQIVISPKDRQIASVCDNTVIIWNYDDGSRHRTLSGHTGLVLSLIYSPNGQLIASSGNDKSVRLWDVDTGDCVVILEGHSSSVQAIAFSPAGNQIASGSEDGSLCLWDVMTHARHLHLTGHRNGVLCLAYSPLGDRIVSGGKDGYLRLWNTSTGACVASIVGHTDWIRSVAYSPMGDTIVSGGDDNILRLWKPEGARETRDIKLTGHEKSIRAVIFSPNGNQFASASGDKTVRLWDIETGDCTQILSGHKDAVLFIAYSPSGNFISSCSSDRTVRLWEVKFSYSRKVDSGHSDGVSKVSFMEDGKTIVSKSQDNSTYHWDVETGSNLYYSSYENRITSMLLCESPVLSRTQSVISLRDSEPELMHHTLSNGSKVSRVSRLSGASGLFVVSPNEEYLAMDEFRVIKIVEKETGRFICKLEGHSRGIKCIVFSPDSRLVVSAGRDGTTRVWDIEARECKHTLGRGTKATSVVFSPNGKHIVAAYSNNAVRIWDVETGDCHHMLSGHTKLITSVSYSPDNMQIATGSEDCSIRLWNLENGDCQRILNHHEDIIRCIAYSPKGNMIATSSDDATVKLWDVENGQLITTISSFHGVVSTIDWAEVSQETLLVTGCSDRSVRLWKVTDSDGKKQVRLYWSSTHDELSVENISMQNIQGLSALNRKLLIQRREKEELQNK